MNECLLRRRVVGLGYACDEDGCLFWAALGRDHEPQCALQYFHLLEGPDSALGKWLLSLKDEELHRLLEAGELPAG